MALKHARLLIAFLKYLSSRCCDLWQ